MKKQLNKISMTLVSAFVFAAALFLSVEQDELGQWKMTVSSSMASGTEDGGTEDGGSEDGGGEFGTFEYYWNASSTDTYLARKITPSNPVTISHTVMNGDITLSGSSKTVSVGAGYANGSSYNVNVTYYKCELAWTTNSCLANKERTLYTY